MANQDFDLTGKLKVRPADEDDAKHLQLYCFPEKTQEQVTEELKVDLAEDSHSHRLVADASGYAIGQITVTQHPIDSEIGQVGDLAVSGPFRQLGVADHLIKAAEATALENGLKTLEVELVPGDAPVIQRYKDWGFDEKPIVTLQKVLNGEEENSETPDTDEDAADEAPTVGEQQELLSS